MSADSSLPIDHPDEDPFENLLEGSSEESFKFPFDPAADAALEPTFDVGPDAAFEPAAPDPMYGGAAGGGFEPEPEAPDLGGFQPGPEAHGLGGLEPGPEAHGLDEFEPATGEPGASPFEEDTPQLGNRPASGARQVSAGDVLSQGFQGSENAGDFLGLDMEFSAEAAVAPDPYALDVEAAPQTDPLPSPVPEAPEVGGDYAEESFDEYDEEFDPRGLEDAYAEELESGEPFEEELLEEAPQKSKVGMLAMSFLVGLIVVLGVTVGPKFLSDDSGSGTEIARGSGGEGPTTDPNPTPAGGTSVELTTTDPVDPVIPDPFTATDPTTEDPTTTDPVDVAVTDPVDPVDPVDAGDPTGWDTIFGGDPIDVANTGTNPVSLGGDTGPVGGDPISQIATLFGGNSGSTNTGFPDFAENFEWVSEDQLDMVWRGTSVPMEAIAAPAKTLMPRVGFVRVHMSSGEVFEGKLFAVGQERIWLDGGPGRIGLDGLRVDMIERLPIEAVSTTGTTQVVSGKRVRVRVPGGVMYGRILSSSDGSVTLMTDHGGKVTLEDPIVEPLGSGRAIVVQQ